MMKKQFFLLIVAMLVSISAVWAQKKKTETTSFWVGGVCGMCKERIEKAVDVKGVRYANYDLDTHTLEITYLPKKISLEKIHQLLNEAGHDTAMSKAPDDRYEKINACCHYRDHDENH